VSAWKLFLDSRWFITPYMSRYLYKIVCKEEIAIVPINVIKEENKVNVRR